MNGWYQNNVRGNNVRLPQLLHNPNPTPLPEWLCPTCSMKLISQYWRTYRRDLQRESNRQIRSFLADPCLRMGTLHGCSGGAWPSKRGPVVQLGVLEPRVENGRPYPQTLDLFGPGKPLEDGKDGGAVKTIIDLDPDCAEDDDGSSSSRMNKKPKIA